MKALLKIAKVAGLVSAFVAIVALSTTLYRQYGEFRSSQLRQWQEVVVHTVISNQGRKGISFDEIRTQYRDAAIDFSGFDVPREEIQTPALRRVLLSLIQKQSIVLLDESHYRALFDPYASQEEFIEKSRRLTPIMTEILNVLYAESDKFTASELERKMLEKFKGISPSEVAEVLQNLTAMRMIVVGPEGKLRNNLTQNPPQPFQAPPQSLPLPPAQLIK